MGRLRISPGKSEDFTYIARAAFRAFYLDTGGVLVFNLLRTEFELVAASRTDINIILIGHAASLLSYF